VVPVVPVFGSTGAEVLWLAVTILMPIAVGLVTSPRTPARYQALLLTALSIVNGLLSEALAAGDGYDWRKAITQAVVAFVVAVAAHFGLWRPTGASSAAVQAGVRKDRITAG
jgi:hypothetical protein